jgi:hypothetical protein
MAAGEFAKWAIDLSIDTWVSVPTNTVSGWSKHKSTSASAGTSIYRIESISTAKATKPSKIALAASTSASWRSKV